MMTIRRANFTSRKLLSLITLTAMAVISAGPLQANSPDRTVVLFLQGSQISAGFAGEAGLRLTMPAAVATSGGSGPMIGMQRAKTVYGDQAVAAGGSGLTYALQSGRITDYAAFEKLLSHILYQKLGVDPSEIAIVMNESLSSPSSERETTTRMMFESIGLPFFFMSPDFQSFAQISEMASQSTFQETLITQDEYDEIGAGIIHRKSQ